jgi:hypothetical protein
MILVTITDAMILVKATEMILVTITAAMILVPKQPKLS